MGYNPANRNSSKHVDLADHYLREQVDLGLITLTYVSTNSMIADALTKPLARAQFSNLADRMMGPWARID